jgi:hypothetical protein
VVSTVRSPVSRACANAASSSDHSPTAYSRAPFPYGVLEGSRHEQARRYWLSSGSGSLARRACSTGGLGRLAQSRLNRVSRPRWEALPTSSHPADMPWRWDDGTLGDLPVRPEERGR